MVIEQRHTDIGSVDRILGELIVEIRTMRDRLEKLERSVDQLNEIKNRGLGILSLIMILSGAAGALVMMFLKNLTGK